MLAAVWGSRVLRSSLAAPRAAAPVLGSVQALRAPVALPLSGNVGQVRSKHYKLKTRKAAAKRLTVLGSGKIKFYTAGLRHNAQPKNAARRRRLRTHQYVPSTLMQHARRMLCI